jgi:GT2 family glycosyltransferase
VNGEPPVTIAVVSWNTRDLLARCLDSIEGDFQSGLASVVVVDNGSTDGSPDLVDAAYPWVDLVQPGENLGFGRAVNLASSGGGSPWIVAANADVELTPGALAALVGSGDRHPNAGAVAPRLILPDGSTQHSVHRFASPSQAAMFSIGAYRWSRRLGERMCIEGRWDNDRAQAIDWAFGAFVLFRRTAFERVGGFDDEQWMYAEDIDIAWRLARAGYEVWYEPDARVRHVGGASTEQAFAGFQRERRHYTAFYAWLHRRRGGPIARTTAAVSVVGELLRYAAFSLLALAAPNRWSAAATRSRSYLSLHRIGLRSPPGVDGTTESPDSRG